MVTSIVLPIWDKAYDIKPTQVVVKVFNLLFIFTKIEVKNLCKVQLMRLYPYHSNIKNH